MIIISKWLKVNGIALWPFILLQNEAFRHNKIIINHERIHLRQQIELLILPFYVLYLINYLVNLIIYRNHYRAYVEIIFEREAYINDRKLTYLRTRPLFSSFKYLFKGYDI